MKTHIESLFESERLYFGRMISPSKEAPKGCTCVWNSNVISPSMGKIWYGDININQDGEKLKRIAKILNEPLYVLKEMDCRFDTENFPIKVLIQKSVWSTDKEIL